MLAIWALMGNGNTRDDNNDLLNARCRRRPGHIVHALAKGAIRMTRAIGVYVCQLSGGAEEQEDREERDEENAGRCIRCSHFASPQHKYS